MNKAQHIMTLLNEVQGVTPEMIQHFETRTKLHIGLVGENLRKLSEDGFWGLNPQEYMSRAESHDASKYQGDEHQGYLWVNWKHKCKRDGTPFNPPAEAIEAMDKVTKCHICANSHHPEFHLKDKNLLDGFARDAASSHQQPCLEVGSMPDLDLIEMVCDWTAMSQELNQGGSARNWADSNLGKRWQFDEATTKKIYDIIDALDKLNGVSRR